MAAVAVALAATGCIRDVGPPPGFDASRGEAVNSRGEAIVTGYVRGGVWETFVLTAAGEWTQPGTDAPGLDVTRMLYAAINDSGAVVGDLHLSHDNPTNPERGNDMQFVWDPERGLREIGLNGGNRVNPADIADDGSIAAWGLIGTAFSSRSRGYLIDGDTLARRELAPLSLFGGSRANAVNSRGEVVGTSDGRYVVWGPPFYWPIALTPLTANDQTSVFSADINDRGEIVAHVLPSAVIGEPIADQVHGIYWDAQRVATRMPAGFLPEAIGDDGTVVGAIWQLPDVGGQPVSAPRAATWVPGDAEATPLAADGARPTSVATGIAGEHVVGWHAPAGAPPNTDQATAVRWSR
jgi:hypothetical protein